MLSLRFRVLPALAAVVSVVAATSIAHARDACIPGLGVCAKTSGGSVSVGGGPSVSVGGTASASTSGAAHAGGTASAPPVSVSTPAVDLGAAWRGSIGAWVAASVNAGATAIASIQPPSWQGQGGFGGEIGSTPPPVRGDFGGTYVPPKKLDLPLAGFGLIGCGGGWNDGGAFGGLCIPLQLRVDPWVSFAADASFLYASQPGLDAAEGDELFSIALHPGVLLHLAHDEVSGHSFYLRAGGDAWTSVAGTIEHTPRLALGGHVGVGGEVGLGGAGEGFAALVVEGRFNVKEGVDRAGDDPASVEAARAHFGGSAFMGLAIHL
jgi:hypothetical protein